jgi:nucleoside-diphosphate-sugar epimerase
MLLESGCHVRILDNFLYGKKGLADVVDHPNLELVEGDVCDRETVLHVVRGTKAVIALAAVVGDAACALEPDRTMNVNYLSTDLLLSACRGAGVKRLVFASSCSVYGANGDGRLHEDSYINPVSLYARTRVMSEDLLLKAASEIEVVILRLATVCGVSPRMRFDLMVNTMTAYAQVQKTVRVTGADLWRPHVHVQDAAACFVRASEAEVASGSVFNVGSDEQNFTIGDVANKVAERIPGVRVEHASSNGDRRSYRVGFERIRTELGFRPRYMVENAIDEVRQLLASGQVADFMDNRFHNARFLGAAH